MIWCLLVFTTLISSARANTGLNVTGIRLTGGSGQYEGRVEVSLNGVWGTICDDSFDTYDAQVLCRMLNLTNTAYFHSARYGQGTGPIFAANLGCNGYETHIQQCYFEPAIYCYHYEDVSLICSNCGTLSVSNGVINSISSDGTTLSTTCNTGYISNYTAATCQSTGSWSPSSISCTKPVQETKPNITDMRLTNGVGLYDGRVEVMVNGTWGDICTNSFSRSDASAICNMLFGLPPYTYYTYDYFNGYGSNSNVYIDRLECTGNEDDINDCYYESTGDCYYFYRASVVCDAHPLDIADIRLADGSGPYDGRVELKYGDEWGTVCSHNFGTYDGHTLCRMMNLSLTTYYTTAKFGSGSGPILIGELGCNSYSDHINDCSYYRPPLKIFCSHSNDVALVCTECGSIQNGEENGQVTSFNGSIMTVTCNTGYVPTTYTAECLSNGTWLQNETCEVFGYPLNITDMRLANGVGLYDGRLEVEVNGTWGTVCSSSFTSYDARAICNIMFGSNYRWWTTSIIYGSGMGPIYIDELDCTGTETHINQCKYNVLNTCSHSSDIAVVCNVAPLNITDIRLTNGTGPYNGRVELLVYGVWGSVCNYNIDLNVGNTLCNMMNLSLWSYYTTPVYGMSSGPMHVGLLTCDGSYTHINQCSYYSPYLGYCSHSNDLSLACTDNRLNITDIRLVPGPYHGRVEVNVNDIWGTVCDNSFYTYDGRVICRMMNGLDMRTVYHNAYYGTGTGPVHIDELSCSGNEQDINTCSYIFDSSCGHNDDASVLCYGSYLNITDTRLADGTGPYDGRMEIEVNGTWGTVCDRSFDINDADAFCQMLGLRAAQYFTGASYGEGSGPVYIDELFCSSGTTDLKDCPYLFMNECGHERDASVVCNECGQPEIYYWDLGYFSFNGTTLYADCAYYKTYIGTLQMTCDNITKTWSTEGYCKEYSFPLDITDIRLVNGNRSSDGRVEIKSLDTWGTICDDRFSMNEANTICQMLGFWPAVTFYHAAEYGAGTGPIFVDDLLCGTNVSHINDCSYVTYDDCNHDDDVSVVCLDCGDPTPSNGMINSTNTNYGTVVEVSCETGYRLIGNDTISCEKSGSWSDLPYCQYIDCGNPVPPHGTVNSTAATNGTVVLVTCNTGHNLSGEAIIQCQSNDTWTDYPTCEILDCGVPTPENADVDLPSNVSTYGAIAVISCKQGYLPDGSSTVDCLETGKWDDIPVCEIVDCGDPSPNKGSVNDTTTTYGTVVEITCNEGHDITGNSTIVCLADGTWSDNPVCDANDCGRPSVSNGQVDTSNGTAPGSIVIITCNPGYDLIGSTEIICLATGWNDTSVDCELQDCGDPTPANGRLVTSSGTEYGNTATIECNEGHEMVGDSTITCEDGGQWSSDTLCLIRDCGNLESPENGNLVHSSGTVFNSTVTFACGAGYLLVGESTLLCQNDGTWSSNVPSCVQLVNIGEACASDEYCMAEGAVCKSSVCSCKTGVYDKRTDKCDTMPLYPYGISKGDHVVTNWNECAGRVNCFAGLPVFGQVHTGLFVCPHGVVSFGRRYNTPSPPKNKDNLSSLNRDMLAPFNAHLNSSSGNVYYRSYDVLDSYGSLIESEEVRDIEERVKQFGSVRSFKSSFVLISTWDNVLPEVADFNTQESQPSTFQLVLVSNGVTTYIFYIYPSGLMKWVGSRPTYAPVWVGYYGLNSSPFTHHYAFTPNALTLDTNTTHGGVSGVVFKPLVRPEHSQTNNNISCITWYQENKHEKQHNDRMNSWLPQCPCDISLARWDPWFWHIDRWNWYNKKNFTCVDMFPGRIYRPYGKSCCYDYRTSLWVDERPIAGGFFRYHPENTIEHYIHDIIPKEMCCSPLNPFCKFYYDLRPTGTCYRESPYNFGSFWGDPHFRTLDGQNFTFNGLGEYTLLQIQTENNTFDLQARTERATKEDGNISDATVFSAFAAKDEANASIHVELNRAKQGFSIYGNGNDITTQYLNKTEDDPPLLNVPGGTLIVSKRGETLVALFTSSGVSLNISVTVEMLSLSTLVPKSFRNVTSGLLGNYNGQSEDDFMLPNGTILSANITDREIFSYGQNWAINGANSAFIYADGKNHSDYHNSSYVPRFLDEVDDDKRLEAENVCGGKENIECVFDYVFTESKDIAEATSMLKGNADKTRKEMDEVLPSLIGCASVNITVNHTVYCPIVIDDGTSVEFLANNVNAKYNTTTKHISYFQATDEPVDLRVVAMNPNGRTSPAFVVAVLLCTGCNGRGYCTDVPREDVRNTEYFKYATCECQAEYEGQDCENLFDGCADDPCSLGRNCTSLDADEQRLNNRTFLCDACPLGFISTDENNDNCLDYNECENNPCSHTCINTEGSYECTCNQGYRTGRTDKHICTDVNECEDLNTPHTCEHNCTNTDGSYNCSCFTGYVLESGTCTQDTSLESKCSNITCSQTGGCAINEEGNAVCFCDTGYELQADDSCIDIDECSRNVCPQHCTNTAGGFECSCFAGYKLEGLATCKECDIGFWGDNCQNACQCTGEGVQSCDRVKGCICEEGWQGDTCDEDIDECNNPVRDMCDDPRKKCENMPGSFYCKCMDGFIETDNGHCEDIDECRVPSLHTCDHICKNNVGSYSCECKAGFRLSGSVCENIDECTMKAHDCEQMCDDNPGSFNCFCYFGYALNDDRRTCTKLSDPCLTLYGLNCSHYCFISTSHSECRCKDGFSLGSDSQTCTDIDECKDNLHFCDANADCKNTDGSYTCECPIGSKLENDGRTCTGCDSFHYGKNCAFDCSCLHGQCDKANGCQCENGWRGNDCDIDFDECDAVELTCPEQNETCINTQGSAVCDCLKGYTRHKSSSICVDVDECSDGRLNTCDQSCVNSPGGYTCECQSGFLFTDGKCRDIDECENLKSDCEQLCENTLGSYRCYCEEGFKLNLTDRESCRPASECLNNTCGEHAVCYIDNGLEICRCVKGFNNESGLCEDVDECKTSPKPCSHHCNNTQGSYNCSCRFGYYLANDDQTCIVCDAGKFGDECSEHCACDDHNSESCDHITGICKCMPGWKGTTCIMDIDECDNETICPEHSTCNNTIGGFDCKCDIGYFKTTFGLCKVCDDSHYGENCIEPCTCTKSNTASCNHISGFCECNMGWTGKNCTEDVDECEQDSSDYCVDNSTCINTQGSYTCKCNEGFRDIGDLCVDIDECIMDIHECNQECVNTIGSYTCKCRIGYHGYWNNCEECSDHTYGENCTETCGCKHTHTNPVQRDDQICDRVTGACDCLVNWKGEFCEEDVDECMDGNICNGKPNSGCVNTAGWYTCQCYRGYQEVDENCVQDQGSTTTTHIPDTQTSINHVLTIGIELLENVNLMIPDTYEQYKELAENSLRAYYKQFTSVAVIIVINGLSKGSLVIDYTVVFEHNDAGVASALVTAAQTLAEGSMFTFNGERYSVNITSDTFNPNDDPCTILHDLGACKLDSCKVENGAAQCKTEQSRLDLPQIIGISVGCGVFVLIIAVSVIICLRRKNNSKKQMKKHLDYRQSLSVTPQQKHGFDDKWQAHQSGGNARRYLTWKTMLTKPVSDMEENAYDVPYKIPRAHTRQPTRLSTNNYTYF